MSSPVVRPGDVVRLVFPHSNPPKLKICLCVCLERGLFLVISTDPYRSAPADSQVKVFKSELDCLEHDSYLDVSKAYDFAPQVIEQATKGGVFRLADTALLMLEHS